MIDLGSARFGHGRDYQYPHDHEGGLVEQDYLGVDKTYYTPTDHGQEAVIRQRLEELRKRRTPNPPAPPSK